MELNDLNGYRKPEDVVRRFNLSKIKINTEDIEKLKQEVICDDHLSITSKAPVQNKVVTVNLNTKVTKETGKGLSTNDFTDEDKLSIHTHSNKTALDTITTTKITNWDNSTIDKVYPVGSIYMSTSSTAPTFTDITFTSVGSMTVGTETIYVYKRTV